MVSHSSNSVLLKVKDLKKYFPVKEGLFGREDKKIHALDGVSFEITKGEVLGLVGESGCGKSTTGRLILRLMEPTEGEVLFEGENIFQVDPRRLRALRKDIQIIFQDPYSSLNPRMMIGRILEEPFIIHRLGHSGERKEWVHDLLSKVGLDADALRRYPHEFSGGQRQRIGIARALALHPRLIVADEPVSSLDVSIQAQIINLLEDLQEEYHLSLLFIAHDLNMVRHISDRVAVMYLGRIVETATTEALFSRPLHPYTEALLSAIPSADPRVKKEKILLPGDLPNPIDIPPGCRFYSRCPKRMDKCTRVDPQLEDSGGGRHVACLLYE